jgi:hypothetical protein
LSVSALTALMSADGDGERDLAVELPRDAAEKRRREEHRHQHQRDADDRARHLVHGLDRGVPGVEPALNMMRGVLDDHDRVVHHDADGEHEPEEREQVHREADGGHAGERADDRDRHRRRGHQHRAPVLQEKKDHDQDERPGLE